MSDNYGIYSKKYSEKNFWNKVKKVATTAGLKVIYSALLLYYTLQKPGLPAKPKNIIYGALGYFIFPLDAIPDITPVIGYVDDFGVLVLALAAVAMYIDDDVRTKATAKLRDWFGDNINWDDIIEVDSKISSDDDVKVEFD